MSALCVAAMTMATGDEASLLELVRHNNNKVRVAVIEVLAEIGTGRSVRSLLGAAQRGADEETRAAAKAALDKIRNRRSNG